MPISLADKMCTDDKDRLRDSIFSSVDKKTNVLWLSSKKLFFFFPFEKPFIERNNRKIASPLPLLPFPEQLIPWLSPPGPWLSPVGHLTFTSWSRLSPPDPLIFTPWSPDFHLLVPDCRCRRLRGALTLVRVRVSSPPFTPSLPFISRLQRKVN